GVQTALGRPQLHPSPPSFTALHDGFALSRTRSADAVVRSTEHGARSKKARSTEQYAQVLVEVPVRDTRRISVKRSAKISSSRAAILLVLSCVKYPISAAART